MHTAPSLLIIMGLVTLTMAGCLGAEADPEPQTVAPVQQTFQSNATVQEPLRATGTLDPSADPLILVDGSLCGPTAQCDRHPFQVEQDSKLDAVLSWGLDVNDMDLHLMQDGAVLASASTLPPGNAELVSMQLAPGPYELVVVGFLVATDDYAILGQFS